MRFFHLLLLLSLFMSFPSQASDRHMVSFGTSGFGWSGSAEKIDSKKDSAFDGVENLLNEVSFNYAYRFSERMQLGGFYQTWHQEYKFELRDGSSSSSDQETQLYGLFLIYNFKPEISDSYFLGLSVSFFNHEEENSGDFGEAENKTPFEIDDTGVTYELVFGKRFSLKKWNINHLTYSPQIGIFHRTHGKDFDDQEIVKGMGFSVQAIKFDFIF